MISRRETLGLIAGAFVVASSLPRAARAQDTGGVKPGIDVLLSDRRDLLSGHVVGLVTNATGRTKGGVSTIDALFGQPDWQLAALFSPEHGIRGEADAGQSVDSTTDASTGLPIYSLYGTTTRPTSAMLQGLDALVFDIQDVGARTYTYPSTLLEVLRAAAAHQLPVLVLDRPNPIGGDLADGNVLDPRFASFVGPAPEAMRHGMTIGELAQFFNAELSVGADVTVVPMQGWQRWMWHDQTGLGWVNPSPNLRSLSAAALYPGTVLFEGTNLSEGRGTDRPFEWIGAPWLDGQAWADQLNAMGVAGVQFVARSAMPDSSKFARQTCNGVLIQSYDRQAVQPMALAVTMLTSLADQVRFDAATFDGLAGTDQLRRAIVAGVSAQDISASWQADLDRFRATRQKYVLY